MPHSVRKLLLDIVISCEEVLLFHKNVSFEHYLEDRKLQLATERHFEIIAHGYDVIDQAVLWDFAVNKVPELLDMVHDYQ